MKKEATMILPIDLIRTVVLLFVSIPAIAMGQSSAIRFEILPGSTYTYFPSDFGPGVTGCSPDEFQCDYGLTGVFSLSTNSDGSALIVNSDLELVGTNMISGIDLTTALGLEAWLENQPLFSIAASATTTTYQTSTNSFTQNPLTLIFDTPGTNGSLSGGYDSRFVDGDGLNIQASLRQVAIPEPSALALLASLAVAASGLRSREC